MECHQLYRNFYNTSRALKGGIKIILASLKLELNEEDKRRYNILEELRTQRARLESILRQKSRETWLKEGDKNSKFFHTRIMVHRRNNKVLDIRDGLNWIQYSRGISDYFLDKFQEIYQSKYPQILKGMANLGQKLVIEQENEAIVGNPL